MMKKTIRAVFEVDFPFDTHGEGIQAQLADYEEDSSRMRLVSWGMADEAPPSLECLWYNGELGCYELLDFDPNGLSKRQIMTKVKDALLHMGFDREHLSKAMETAYLLDIRHLKNV